MEKQLKEEYRRWLHGRFVPVIGAEDDDDDKSSEDNKDEPVDKGESEDDTDNDTDDDEDKSSDDAVAQLQNRNKELEDRLSRAEHAAATAKKRAGELEADAATKSGNFKHLAQQRENELKDEREAREKSDQERDSAHSKLTNFEKRVRVVSIAQKLGYRDPEDAMAVLEAQEKKLASEGKDEDLMGDDISCERALRKLGETKKYLVDQKRRTGAPMNGNTSGSPLSAEQIKAMSPSEIIARKDEVDKSMAILYGNTS